MLTWRSSDFFDSSGWSRRVALSAPTSLPNRTVQSRCTHSLRRAICKSFPRSMVSRTSTLINCATHKSSPRQRFFICHMQKICSLSELSSYLSLLVNLLDPIKVEVAHLSDFSPLMTKHSPIIPTIKATQKNRASGTEKMFANNKSAKPRVLLLIVYVLQIPIASLLCE